MEMFYSKCKQTYRRNIMDQRYELIKPGENIPVRLKK